ncbi:alpha/beta hydrolase [Conexibacter woesei]|uniref:alpha/beta hydrolase n=1 Tax=Conexibacter woesei TaxID=191495 RepID=UPI0002F97D60|nr:alpha/beta hydrolase [Conexibacter woesei]
MPDLAFDHHFEPGTAGDTLLLLHATGGDERQLVPLGRQLAPGAALLAPRGQVLENGRVRRFFARRGPADLDLDDLRERTTGLAAFVGDTLAQRELDPARVTALGYSNGANVAVELLFSHPGLLHAAALLRPVLAYEPEQPLTGLDRTSVLIAVGDADPYGPSEQIERLTELLREGGADVEVAVQPAGHELTEGDFTAVGDWLARVR